MTKYELTLLLEEEKILEEIKKLLEAAKAKIVLENKWGKKSLSYPIKKKLSAYYFNLVVDLDLNEVNPLKKKLDYDEKIMRYLLLKID